MSFGMRGSKRVTGARQSAATGLTWFWKTGKRFVRGTGDRMNRMRNRPLSGSSGSAGVWPAVFGLWPKTLPSESSRRDAGCSDREVRTTAGWPACLRAGRAPQSARISRGRKIHSYFPAWCDAGAGDVGGGCSTGGNRAVAQRGQACHAGWQAMIFHFRDEVSRWLRGQWR